MVNGPPPTVCASCMYIRVRLRERKGERVREGQRERAVCARSQLSLLSVRRCGGVALSSRRRRRRSKLLNVKVGLVPAPGRNLCTALECEMPPAPFPCCAPAARWVRSPEQVRECYPSDRSPGDLSGPAPVYSSLSYPSVMLLCHLRP